LAELEWLWRRRDVALREKALFRLAPDVHYSLGLDE
jgi:hypothetical protein